MSTAARLGAVLAVVVMFGATAVLAIALTRGVPLHASLVSVGSGNKHHAAAGIGTGRSGSPVFTRHGTGENGNHDPQRDRDRARRLASPSSE